MGRCRLTLRLLQTPKARKKAYQTRKRGLEKKANELCTLCGVDACLIMFPPPLKNEEIEPYVWSNKPDQVANLIESHKLSDFGYSPGSRACNLSSFYKDRTRKVEEEIEKVKKKIRQVKYPNWDEQYDSFSDEELRMFARMLTNKVDSTKEAIKLFKERKDQVPESSFSVNIPRIDANPDSSLGRKLQQHPQSYLENQMMMINNGGNNPYDHNVMNFGPLMSYYYMQNVAGYGQELMISPAACFPQMCSGFHPSMGSF